MTDETYFGLRFRPSGRDTHSVTVETLIPALEGLQRTARLVAMMDSDLEVGAHGRIDREIKKRFRLRWTPSSKGSLHQPVVLEGPDGNNFGFDSLRRVSSVTKWLMSAAAKGDDCEFERHAPKSAYWPHLLSSLGKTFGKGRGRCDLSIEEMEGTEIARGESVSKGLALLRKSLRGREESEPFILPAVTGYLGKIDLRKSEISLVVPGRERQLICGYSNKHETLIIDNRKDLIQIEGDIVANGEEVPQRIAEVSRIQAVNTEDIDMVEILPKNLEILNVKMPSVEVFLSEDKQVFHAEYEAFDICQVAYTRAEMLNILKSEMEILWMEYALEDDEKLSPCARVLKRKLKRSFREVVR